MVAASTSDVFAAEVNPNDEVSDSTTNVDTISDENILIEKDFETNEIREVVVENDGREIYSAPVIPIPQPELLQPKSVIGSDNRREMSSYLGPIYYIEAWYSNGVLKGTAFVVGTHTLVTSRT